MKHLRKLAAATVAAAALSALLGAGSASATTLEVGGVTQNGAISISATLKYGTSTILRDTSGFSAGTCTSSEMAWKTESPFSGATVTGNASTLTFSVCSGPTTVHKTGTLHVAYTSGTNGTVSSSGAEWTTDGPFGYLNCVTGTGTTLGTLTGAVTGHAAIDVNAVLNCGISARLGAIYAVTSPTGLGVEK
jgi:hypothetical protein